MARKFPAVRWTRDFQPVRRTKLNKIALRFCTALLHYYILLITLNRQARFQGIVKSEYVKSKIDKTLSNLVDFGAAESHIKLFHNLAFSSTVRYASVPDSNLLAKNDNQSFFYARTCQVQVLSSLWIKNKTPCYTRCFVSWCGSSYRIYSQMP